MGVLVKLKQLKNCNISRKLNPSSFFPETFINSMDIFNETLVEQTVNVPLNLADR